MREGQGPAAVAAGPVQPLLSATGLTKLFPGVTALDDIDFTIAPGEIVALLPDGIQVVILEGPIRADGYAWYRLEAERATGWAVATFLIRVAPDASSVGRFAVGDSVAVAIDGGNLRNGPGLDFSVAFELPLAPRRQQRGQPLEFRMVNGQLMVGDQDFAGLVEAVAVAPKQSLQEDADITGASRLGRRTPSPARRGAVVDDLAEARDYATRVVESFIGERSRDDWRDWVLHVSDDRGDELFLVPFAFVLGKPN